MMYFKNFKKRTLYRLGIRSGAYALASLLSLAVYGQPCNLTVDAGNNVSICSGTTTQLNAITTGGVGITKYSWSPVAGLSNADIANPIANPTVTTTYKVTVIDDNCLGADAKSSEIVVTVKSLPLIEFTFTNDNTCSGTSVSFSSLITGTDPFSYVWNFGDGTNPSTSPNPSHVFTGNTGNALQPFNVTLEVTNTSTNCVNVITKRVNVMQVPDASLNTISGSGATLFDSSQGIFLNCGATTTSPQFDFVAVNASSTISSNTSYVIEWGDGSSDNLASSFLSISHRYLSLGYFDIKFTITNSATGCTNSKVYKFFNGNSPGGNLANISNTTDCVPYTLSWPVVGTQDNTPGTKYEFSVDDGSASQFFTQKTLPTLISHEFKQSSCSKPNKKFVVTFKITNPCYESAPTIQVQSTQKPIAQFNISPNSKVCVNNTMTFTNTSLGNYTLGNSCAANYDKTWEIIPNTGWTVTAGALTASDVIKIKFDTPGNYAIKLKIHQPGSVGSRCTEDEITENVCIETPLDPQFALNNINNGCAPYAVTTTNTTYDSNVCSPPTYLWSVTSVNPNCGIAQAPSLTGGTTYSSLNPSFLFTNPGIYTIILSATNSCGTKMASQTITVKGPPTVSITNINPICQTLPTTVINPTATVADCGSSPLAYEWSFPGGITSTSPNPGPISITGSGPYTVALKVTNGCGFSSVDKTFTINALPTLAGTLSACVGLTSQLTGSGIAATNSPWISSNTYVATIDPTGLIKAVSAGTTTITYTNNNDCKVASIFTVNALPTITGSLSAGIGYTSQLTGSGIAAASSPWVSSNASIATINNEGLVTAVSLGTSIITYTNTDGCQVKATFTMSSLPTISGNLSACLGTTSNLFGSATPSAINPWISSDISVATVGNTGLVNSVSVGTTTITYTNNVGSQAISTFTVNALPVVSGILTACVNTTSQLTGSGTAATILPWGSSNPSIAAVDNNGLVTGVSVGTAIVTYTNSNGCKVSSTFRVNALPTITGDLSICIGSTSQLTGSEIAAPDLPWLSSNTVVATVSNIGIVNALSAGTSVISYTNSNGCRRDITLTVNPTPTVDQPMNFMLCNGLRTDVVSFSGNIANTTYTWSNSDPSIGISVNGSGNIQSFIPVNHETSPVTASISVTPTANGCAGEPKTFTITVNPSPIVTFSSLNQTICSGVNTVPVTLNSTTSGVTFEWSSVSPIGISGAIVSGTGTIPVQTLVNATNVPLVVIYKAKASFTNGVICKGEEYIYTITVNPVPMVSSVLTTEICSGSSFSIASTTGNGNIVPSGTTYTWSAPTINPDGTLSGAIAQSTPQTKISQQLINLTNNIATATYQITPLSGNCTGQTFEVIVTVKPTPTVESISDFLLCNGVLSTKIDFSGAVAGTVFNWTNNNTSIGLAASGNGSLPVFSAVNLGITAKIATITVTPSANGCFGLPKTFTITAYPLLPVSVSISPDANNICPGINVTYHATPINGGLNPIYEWKVNGIVVGTLVSSYSYAPENGDKVECKLLSNAICPTGNPAQSNLISMVVFSSLPARIDIIESSNDICPGESATFTATPFNGGSNPAYQWFVNGIKVGSNLPVYSYEPVDGDMVTCQLISSNVCSSNGVIVSTPVKMLVSPPALQPLFTIEQLNDCAPIKVILKNNSLSGGLAYIWDFGDGETFTSENPVDVPHTFENFTAAPIEFTVSLKIVTRYTHCFNTLTKKIIVKPELFAGSPVSYMGCSPFIQKFENAYAGAKSYRWIDSKKTVLSDKLQPTLTFTASKGRDSTHIVYLIAESFFGCFDTIVNTINVSPGLALPSFTYSGKADCKSVTYTFKNTSPEGASVFIWDFGDGTINKTYHANEVVTHTFFNGLNVAVPFNVILTGSSGTSCSLSVTKKIMVDPEYMAGFPVTFQGCNPLVRTFVNAYEGSKSYQWKSSDWKLLSTEKSPTLNFNALLERDSTHLVYLIAESLNGCIDTIVNNVIVRAANKAAFSAIPTEGCAPLPIQFTNTSSLKTNGYQWDFNDGSDCSIVENPNHIFIDPNGLDKKYMVSLIAFNQYGCADTAFQEIHLLPTPQVNFVALPIMQTYPERTVKLTNLTPLGNWTYSWNLGDQKPFVTGLLSDYIYDLPGEYVISLTAKGAQCENTKRVKVTINPGTPLALFEPDTSGCAPMKVKFRNNSQNGSRYEWDFGNGTQSVDYSPSTTYYDEGTFSVKLKVFNQFGVMDETERKIVIHPVAKALFNPLPYRVKIPAQAVTFFNNSENAKDFLWDFGDGGSSFDIQPIHQYTQTGVFNVTLYITSNEGCKDTFLLTDAVDAFSDGLKVPNAFMPNKEGPNDGHYVAGDPRNHIFYPAVAVGDLIEYELMIYNRWGNLLFVTKEAERGWDGYYNGVLCPQDVYIWKIRCHFKSGSIITKTGDVTLIQ